MARRDIDRLQAEVEELFADLWQVPRFTGLRHGFRPAVDCYQTAEPNELTIVVELPGVDPETVELLVDERRLTVSGERQRPRVPGQVFQQMEIEYGSFARSIQLREEVDGSAARVRYEHGLLTVTLPIAARPPRRKPVAIPVRRAGGR